MNNKLTYMCNLVKKRHIDLYAQHKTLLYQLHLLMVVVALKKT